MGNDVIMYRLVDIAKVIGEICHTVGTSKSNIGRIGCLLNEGPEDLARRNLKAVIPAAIHADVHQPDEAAFPARHSKRVRKPDAVKLLVVLFVVDLPPALPIFRRLDDSRFQMVTARISITCADHVVRWHNPLLLEIVAQPMIPHVRNISSAKS
jgi:hypothetical protein